MGYEIDLLPVGEGEKSGDAIALRFGNLGGGRTAFRVVVIDGGFKDSGEALVDHIAKYYHTDSVDLVISTHPDADHASGLEVVLERCQVGQLWMHLPWNHTNEIASLFKAGWVTDRGVKEALRRSLENAHGLETLARKKNIPITEPFTGVTDPSQQIIVVGPSRPYYESLLPSFRGSPQAQAVGLLSKTVGAVQEVAKRVLESWGKETLTDDGETSAENDSSVVTMLVSDNERVLFTADAGIVALTRAMDTLNQSGITHANLHTVQVPHHGSKRNVGPSVLDRMLGPRRTNDTQSKIALVSAAEDGAPKHPAKSVTNAFRRRGAHVWGTLGGAVRHARNAPDRGWPVKEPIPFHEGEVDE